MTTKHTPGMWHWTWDGEGQPGRVGVVLPCEPVEHCGYDSHCIALTQPGKFDARANAERIVQCVNAHDELAALLQETLRPGAYGIGSTLAARIEAALAKAGVPT